MTLKQFIRENAKEIDIHIAGCLHEDKNPRPNYEERRLWVLNDEFLYNWARGMGVRI